MGDPLGPVAVGRQQQQPLGVAIEAAHGEQARYLRQQVVDGGPALGIVPGGDVAGRLVQHQILVPGGVPDRDAIDRDAVSLEIGARAKLARHLAVDGHAPGHDQLLGGAARGDTGAGQDLLQALFH
jgi:hypothetical protein